MLYFFPLIGNLIQKLLRLPNFDIFAISFILIRVNAMKKGQAVNEQKVKMQYKSINFNLIRDS